MTMVGRDKVKKDQMMLGTLLNQFKRGQINKNHPLQRRVLQYQYKKTENIRVTRNHCFIGNFEEVKMCHNLNSVKTLQIIGSQVR